MGIGFLPVSGATAEEIAAISANLSTLGYIVNITSQGGTAIQGPTMYYEDFETEANIAFKQNFIFDSSNNRMTSNIGGLVPQGFGTPVGGMINNGGLAASFDGNTLQGVASSSVSPSTNGNQLTYVGKSWGAGLGKVINQLKVYPTTDAGFSGNTATIKLIGSTGQTGTGSQNIPAGTIVELATLDVSGATTLSQTLPAVDLSTAYEYHWAAVSHTGGFGTNKFAEVEFTEVVTTPRILTSASKVFTSQPETLQATIFFTQVDNIDPSDFVFEVSRDGGNTFTTIPLAQLGIQVINSNKILTGSVDVSPQPAGTNIVYRLTNNTLKNYFIEQIHVQKVG